MRSRDWDLAQRLDAEVAICAGKPPPVRRLPEIIKREKSPPRRQRVYIVRFSLRDNPRVSFIKIGISGLSLLARFQRDERLYDIELIKESDWLEPPDALAAEQAIHAAFVIDRYHPPVPLASGNTECYVFTSESVQKISDIISSFTGP